MLEALVDGLQSAEAVLGLIIAAAGVAVSVGFALHQNRLARRQRAADLFDDFYSADNYHAMVAQVYEMSCQWRLYTGRRRAAFAAALCQGWTSERCDAQLRGPVDPGVYDGPNEPTDVSDFESKHFRRSRSTEEVTEHAALTAFLYFWVKLDAMVKNKLVCETVVKRLFQSPYALYAPFLASLRAAVAQRKLQGDTDPAWFEATRHLEDLLLEGDKPTVYTVDFDLLRDPPDAADST